MRTISFVDLAINNTKQWLVATAKTAKLVKLFKNETDHSICSAPQINHKIIIKVIVVDAVANQVK